MKDKIKTLFLIYYSVSNIVAFGQSDGTPPLLNSVSVSPTTLNNGDSVTVFIDITDNFSGVNGNGFPGGATGNSSTTQARISNPTNSQIADVTQWNLVSGNTYFGKAKISNYAINGTWKVQTVLAVDHAGNYKSYQNGTDFNATFQVNSSTPDTSAPVLNSITVSPTAVNNGDTITVLIEITDNVSGVNGNGFPGGATGNGSATQARISNPNNSQIVDISNWVLVSGNIYSGKAKISNFAINGTWKVQSVLAVDYAGNYKSYQNGTNYNATFQVNSSTPDDTPPTLNSVSVNPVSINAGDSITVFIDITDNVSGVNGNGFPGGATGNGSTTQARISNPTNSQIVDISSWILVSGNIYSGKAKISAFGVNGVWKVESVLTVDHAGNYKSYQNCSNYIATFNVGNVSPDINAPILNSVVVTPSSVNPGDSVLVKINLTDNVSFVNGIGLPGYISAYSSTEATISDSINNQQVTINKWNVISCGNYSAKIKVPTNASPGLWKVTNVVAYDRVGNTQVYQNEIDYNATFQVSGTSGIIDFSKPNSIIIFPNPANFNNLLTIKGKNIKRIVLFDILGAKIFESDFQNLSEVNLSLEKHNNGIYFLQITTNNEIISKKILIK